MRRSSVMLCREIPLLVMNSMTGANTRPMLSKGFQPSAYGLTSRRLIRQQILLSAAHRGSAGPRRTMTLEGQLGQHPVQSQRTVVRRQSHI